MGNETKTRKPRAKKVVEPKYNLQVPIDKGIETKLRAMAEEMGLGLTQYCRWVLMQHTKGVEVQVSTTKQLEQVAQSFVTEQVTEPKATKPKVNKKFGAK